MDMQSKEQEPKPPDRDDEVLTPEALARILGYKKETVRAYSTQHPERLPPRIARLKHPRWLRSVVMQWLQDSSRPINIEPPPELSRKPRVGRPRKPPAY